MLRILGKATSINVRKVLWTCAELGLEYELEEWGSGFRDTNDPAFLVLNPNALVPVVIDGDLALWESNSICRYLASSRERRDLLPAAPAARARVEQWMDWQATQLNTAWRHAFMALVRQSPEYADAAQVSRSVSEWNRHMEILERQLSKSDGFVVDGGFTLADVVLGLATHRWFSTPMKRPHLPAVEAYYDRLSQREGYRTHGRNGTP
jgi:glutathione S-transferase